MIITNTKFNVNGVSEQAGQTNSEMLGDAESEIYSKLEELDAVFLKYKIPFVMAWTNLARTTGPIHIRAIPNEEGKPIISLRELTLMIFSLHQAFMSPSGLVGDIPCSEVMLEEAKRIFEIQKEILEWKETN